MIYLLQILKMLDNDAKREFCLIFSDCEYLTELNENADFSAIVHMTLFDDFNIGLEDQQQLEVLSKAILRNQNRLEDLSRLV